LECRTNLPQALNAWGFRVIVLFSSHTKDKTPMKTLAPALRFIPALLISLSAFMVVAAVPLSILLLVLVTSIFGLVLFVQIMTVLFQPDSTPHSPLLVILAHLAPFWSQGALIFTLLMMDEPISDKQICTGLVLTALSLWIILKPSRSYLKTNHFLRVTAWVSVITLLLIVLIRVIMRFS
jgi:hypothetical protein